MREDIVCESHVECCERRVVEEISYAPRLEILYSTWRDLDDITAAQSIILELLIQQVKMSQTRWVLSQGKEEVGFLNCSHIGQDMALLRNHRSRTK